uniref:ATP-dependent protease proteolytic subunit n=1 Tax=Lobelia zeylanica TaxID=1068521 RepID=UPI002551E16B|nr:ATP-dependent protease proteolytic subunit [Lobelia zeylanica]WGH11673.1 ATP-dependent protease proteolytic subunit [Lobelia zeylanica]
MPVGVPQIPYQVPDDEDASWLDLYNGLSRERVLFLFQELNTEVTNQLVGLMVFLTIEDNTQEQFIMINSNGGALLHGISIHNTIGVLEPDIYTVCLGIAASTASFILAGGTLTKRIAFPHSRVMIHQPRAVFTKDKDKDEDKDRLKRKKKPKKKPRRRKRPKFWEKDENEDILRDAQLVKDLRYEMASFYAARSSTHSVAEIYALMERDTFMTPAEAKDFGIVDAVGVSEFSEYEEAEEE